MHSVRRDRIIAAKGLPDGGICLTMILVVMLFFGIMSLALKLVWNLTKFALGLGLFCFCPLLFVLVVLLGGFSHLWLPILIVGLLFGGMFRRA